MAGTHQMERGDEWLAALSSLQRSKCVVGSMCRPAAAVILLCRLSLTELLQADETRLDSTHIADDGLR